MGRVVVADQMQRLALRRFTVDLAQEVEPLDMAMALLAARDNRAVEGIHRGKQRGGAVALVVVRHGGGTPLLQRQSGLRSIKRLDLALLVAAQDQRVLGR